MKALEAFRKKMIFKWSLEEWVSFLRTRRTESGRKGVLKADEKEGEGKMSWGPKSDCSRKLQYSPHTSQNG